MKHARPPFELVLEGSPVSQADAWKKWRQRFNASSGTHKEDSAVQASLLINLIWPEGFDINNCEFSLEDGLILCKMSVTRSKGPIIDPGLCRCCGGLKKCRLLNVEYEHMGQKEVYADIMMDCFGLLLSNLDAAVTQRLVCATCVVRLREASIFKQQVLSCEEALLSRLHAGEEEFKVKVELEVKNEEVPGDTAGSPAGDAEDTLEDNGIDPSSDDDTSKDECKLSEIQNDIRKRKLEESNKDVVKKKKKERKLVSKKSAVEQIQTKRDILIRINKLNNMLKQKLNKPAPAPPPPPRRRPPAPPPAPPMSRERRAHDNTVLLVENSYVCPFRNRISNYYCFYCKEIFTDCHELRAHTLSHDPASFEASLEGKRVTRLDVTRVDCRLCDARLADVEAFKRHAASVHNKIVHPVADEFLQFRLTMDALLCLECGNTFPFIDKLIEHMTEHFGKFVCDVCGACFIEESSLGQHMRKHSRVRTDYPCHVCGNTLKSNYSRQLHIATVHEKRAVVGCYKCEASFLSYAQRNRHLINVHGDRRKFPCKSCDKVFDARKTMVEHTRKYHLQVCRHQCHLCHQRFYAPSQLREHLSSHGEREPRRDKTPRRRDNPPRLTPPPPPLPPLASHQPFHAAGFNA